VVPPQIQREWFQPTQDGAHHVAQWIQAAWLVVIDDDYAPAGLDDTHHLAQRGTPNRVRLLVQQEEDQGAVVAPVDSSHPRAVGPLQRNVRVAGDLAAQLRQLLRHHIDDVEHTATTHTVC